IGQGAFGDVDVAATEVAVSAAQIPQLAHFEPVRTSDLLDQITGVDSSLWWCVTEGQGGRPAPQLRKWPQQPRYIIDDRDSYVRQGQEFSQANRVVVSFVDQRGWPRSLTATLPVPALDDAGVEVFA